jgi:acyl transferase domain-containing protein/acyl carrier protein
MASLEGDPRELEDLLRGFERRVSVAARNAPNASVVSGDTEAVEAVVRNAEARGMRSRWLPVNYAFHSPQMGPLAEELSVSLGTMRSTAAGVPVVAMVSTVTGGLLQDADLTREYWAENVRRPVRFADAVGRLLGEGITTFVEISPHPVLSASILECAGDQGAAIGVVASLRRGQPERFTMRAALGALWTRGVAVDWPAYLGDAGPPVSLPPYAWQRKRFWLAPRPVDRPLPREYPGDMGHPLLGRRLDSPLPQAQYEALFDSTALPFVSDHRILGASVVPATAFIETALAAAPEILGPGECTIESLELEHLLALVPGGRCLVHNVFQPAGPDASILEVHSRSRASGEAWTRHALGRIIRVTAWEAGDDPVDLDAAVGRCGDEQEGVSFYETMGRAGIEFGPRFRGIDRIWLGEREAVAEISRPRVLGPEQEQFRFHPALLDACLQPLGWLCLRTDGERREEVLHLPVAIERVRVRKTTEDRFRVHVSLRGSEKAAADEIADVRVFDGTGRPVASLDGVRLHRTSKDSLARLLAPVQDSLVYDLDWKPAPTAVGRREHGGCWLVMTGADPLGGRIADELSKKGRVVTASPGPVFRETAADRYEVDPTRPEDIERVLAAIDRGPDLLRGSVSLWALDFGLRPSDDAASLEAAEARLCGGALHLVQALSKRSIGSGFRLVFVTRGTQAVGPGPERVEVAQSPIWGFGSVVALEHPALGSRLVDLGHGTCDEEAGALLSEIFSGDGEPKVALRTSGRYVARLARRSPQALTGGGAQVDTPVQVMIRERGELDNLRVCPMERRPPGFGEAEVRVGATGLNFRDVMNALGTYPGEAGPLGDECSGVVSAVGPGVAHLLPGDEVMGFVPAAFGSFVTAPADLFVKRPERLSREEAAATPIAFLTAEYALTHIGRLQSGERVLIHAAAGGVGLAAVQIAQRTGAEVFATAGNPEKRAYLTALGVRHVMDSRSTAFAEEVLAATGGEGVDVVLNSLAGEFIPRSLAVLKAGGRFLELGRTGVWNEREVAALGRGLRYEVVFLGILRTENPKRIRELLGGIAENLSRGTLRPLPVKVFDRSRIVEAFRFMAQAKHIGKIVVRHPATTASATRAGDAVRTDATYIVTGGAGALGLQVARLLVERGARCLLLVGRSAPGDAALQEISRLEQAGARVAVVQADVSKEEDCDRLFRLAQEGWPPVRGVVHAAGVVEDATVDQQTLPGFLRVLKPKALGAWNLHRRLGGSPLDFFVFFSSVASLFGSAGQANYAAANAFLDSLAHDRRAMGLPAMSINWGPWADAGMAASLGERDQRRLADRGMRPLPPGEGREVLGRLLDEGGGAQAIVASMNWQQAVEESEGMRRIASEIGDRSTPSPPTGGAEPRPAGLWVQGLRDAPGSRRRTLLVQHLRELVARVFGLDLQTVEAARPLREIGLDSLLAVELRNAVGREMEKSLPASLLFDYPTVDALANHLLAEVLGLDDSSAAGKAGAAARAETFDGMKELDPLSEEEAEALLLKELGAGEDGAHNG